jgi:hypothetical protein
MPNPKLPVKASVCQHRRKEKAQAQERKRSVGAGAKKSDFANAPNQNLLRRAARPTRLNLTWRVKYLLLNTERVAR